MARTVNEVKLTLFMVASDYDPTHYKWTETELSALGNCRATAEVIKKRLEDNGTKVMKMYAIEHKGEKTADSKSEEHHKGIDETKLHYHIVVKFESKQATLKDIAKYIGVRPEIIEKADPGRHSYDKMLSYLTHIKYVDMIQYTPEDVVTLAGSDYTLYYNKHKESWIKARHFIAKNGGKPLNRLFREAVSKMESGELFYDELAGISKYRKLLFDSRYQPKLEAAGKRVAKVAELDLSRLCDRLANNEISKEDAKTCEEYNLVFKYYNDSLIDSVTLSIRENKKYGII